MTAKLDGSRSNQTGQASLGAIKRVRAIEEKKGQEPNWQIRQFVYLPICPYMLLTLFLAPFSGPAIKVWVDNAIEALNFKRGIAPGIMNVLG